MHRVLEMTGGALAATATVAQVDIGPDNIAGYLAKGGAVAVVGLLFWWFMRLSAKQNETLAAAHLAAVTKLASETKDAAALVAKEHKESVATLVLGHKEAVATLVLGHKEAVDRIEAAHMNSATRFETGAQKIVDAVQANVLALQANSAKCAETIAILKAGGVK